jgi:hypothetical protein
VDPASLALDGSAFTGTRIEGRHAVLAVRPGAHVIQVKIASGS